MKSRFLQLLFVGVLAASPAWAVPPTPSPSPAVTPAVQAPQAGAVGLGDAIYPELGNGGYQVRHYALDIRFDENLAGYTAISTLDLHATQALSRFDLDLKGTTVNGASLDGRAVKWSRSGEELQVTPPAPLKRGADFSVRVQVRGTVAPAWQSRLFGTLSLGLMRSGDWVQTVCQPGGAHRIAALADHPSQKAPATITVTAPSRLGAIANGDLTGTWRTGTGGNFTVRRFEMRQKLAPELLQIAVGPFTLVEGQGPDGIALRSVLPTDALETIKPRLDIIPRAIQFLEDHLGPFPLRTYGIFASPIGIGGGLESQSLTLLDESFMNLKPEAFRAEKISGIMTHELAHEYFGNTVSPRTWSDVWLNEGQATYYETLWNEAEGTETMEESMQRAYQIADGMMNHFGPVAAPRREAFFPRDMAPYGPVAYQGGCLALYALRQEVGTDTFERIERAWVQTYRDGVAGTSDFIALASKVAGRDLGPFLRSWLYSNHVPAMPGHPDWHSAPRPRRTPDPRPAGPPSQQI